MSTSPVIMKVPALILAGGKGRRLEQPIEKPLIDFLGKPFIDCVVEAVKASKSISTFYVVTSCNTPDTEKRCIQKRWNIIRTDAKGYHRDLQQAILENKLNCPLLTISADLPTLTGEFLDKVVATYEKSGKDALTVLVPVAARVKFGLSVSATDCCEDGLYVSGINMINGAKICEATIPSVTLLTEEAAVLLNINTAEDLEIAKQIITKKT